MSDPLLMIGGAPRSGTTLLRNMVAAHPLVAVPDESYFIIDVLGAAPPGPDGADVASAWAYVRQHRFFASWGLDVESVDREVLAASPRSRPELLRVLFAAYAASRGKPLFADKTTSHALCFDVLADAFPATRFVHIVRDSRAACMSLSVQHWVRRGLVEAAATWQDHVGRARRASARLGPRFLEIRYERLIAEPDSELQRLCAFAGIDFDGAMLNHERGRDLPPDPHHQASRREVGADPRGWAGEMSGADIALVELVTGAQMRDIGYPITTGAARRAAQLPALLAYKVRCRAHQAALARSRSALPRRRARMAP